MPSSAPSLLGWVFEHVERLRPKRVLDVGIGFGKYGFLTKEYAQARHPGEPSSCYLVGVEVFSPYITTLHHHIYDEIIIGDIRECMFHNKEPFDLVIMADVIEHFHKQEGEKLLEDLKAVSKKLIITSPIVFAPQDAEYGNVHEIHRSLWSQGDFLGCLLDSWQRGCVFGVYIQGKVR